MNKTEAGIILIFVTPNPDVALCVTMLDYGKYVSKPYLFPAKQMKGVVDKFERERGYRVFENIKHGFESYILVAKDVEDANKAVNTARAFMIAAATSVMDELS